MGFGIKKDVTSNVTPSTIVYFDKATPTEVGVVFTPNTPATVDVLYISSVDVSTWIWNGSVYISYVVPSATEWYLYGTTIDAGGNKTADIQRSGAIFVNVDSYFNDVRVGRGSGGRSTNTIVGDKCLQSNTTGIKITAVGAGALQINTASDNTAVGWGSLNSNTTGSSNVAIGSGALLSNSTGFESVAIGFGALNANNGNLNVSVGFESLNKNSSGGGNSAIGHHSLYHNLTGSNNSGVGYQSGKFLANGSTANATGFNSVFIGANTKARSANNENQIVIGYNAIGQGSNTVQLGNTSIIKTYLQGAIVVNNAYQLTEVDGTANQVLKTNGAGTVTWGSVGTVTSVGLTMPSAFGVANSPITTSGSLNVTAVGSASQYIRGDGNLADFPTQTGGGSAVVYYFNGGTNQGTFGGSTYYEMSKDAVIGTQVTFVSTAVDGLLTQYITDPLDPSLLEIPAGNWSFGTYWKSSSAGGSPSFYVELLKYSGTTFTTIATNSANPEGITNNSTIDVYYSELAVPQTTLLATDRLAIRFYVNTYGKTLTFYNQGTTVSQVITTVSFGLTALNGLTKQVQYFATGTSGTDFNISSVTDTHTFNIPTASATNRGALSSANWTTFNGKQNAITLTTTGTSGAATLVGSTLNVPNYATSTGGIWGIANASGVYTYYATYQLAVAAATAGQTIEMFGSQTESIANHILKTGVNINYNGYTLTFLTGCGIIDNGVACEVQLLNGEIKKGIGGQIAIYVSSSSTILRGNVLVNSSLAGAGGTGSYGYYGIGKVYGLNFKGNDCVSGFGGLGDIFNVTINCTSGTAVGSLASFNSSTINSISTASAIATIPLVESCTIKTNGAGGYTNASGGIVNNSTFYSLTNRIIDGSQSGLTFNNCSFNSRASTVYNFGGGFGNSVFNNCTLRSLVYINNYASGGNMNNCIVISETDICLYYTAGVFVNNNFTSLLNSASGRIAQELQDGTRFIGNTFNVTSSSAVALYSTGAPVVYISGNNLKGSSLLKSAGVVNAQTNTADAQGNTILN